MMLPLWGLFGVFTVLVAPLTQAASPVSPALPQDIQYNEYVADQLDNAAFSNDPFQLLDFYAQEASEDKGSGAPRLEAFLLNPNSCSNKGDSQDYRVTVRNVGNETADNILVQVQYPAEMRVESTEPEAENDKDKRLLTWVAQDLAPGGLITFAYTLHTEKQAKLYLNNLTVYYFNKEGNSLVTLGERRLSGECSMTDSIRNFLAGRSPVFPAIVCDPAEIGCVDTYQTLKLGRNYFKALAPEQRPVVCSQIDQQLRQGLVPPCKDFMPQLGKRFAEAVADVVPGDCRVLEDSRIIEPTLHDALARRSSPAAAFMRPLYNSGDRKSGG